MWVNHGYISGWLSVSSVTDSQLSYTHPCNLNDLLVNLNWLGIHAFNMTLYCIIHSFIDYTELQPPIAVSLHHFMFNLSWITCEFILCPNIAMMKLIWYQSHIGNKIFFKKNMIFVRSSMQNWAKSQIAVLPQKPKVYHLIPKVKEFFFFKTIMSKM